MSISRRNALALFGAAAPASAFAASGKRPHAVDFVHGVASGDPTADGFVLWTRLTPAEGAPPSLKAAWEVAEDAAFTRLAARGTAVTGAHRDYTVKVEVEGLKSGRQYHYRFRSGGQVSRPGRATTLPTGATADVVLAIVTCSLHPNGYFNVYDHIAGLGRVDAVVHLGDYIYEFGAGEGVYGMENGRKLGRIPEPPHEIVTLADYRTRHAQYKRDPDLQAAHARCPWICVWDDHEVSNDDWVGGAENHQPKTEGPWLDREAAAVQAYYEWMPIREPKPGRAFEAINRAFQYGDLMSLIMVESRLVARSYQLEYGRAGDVPLAVYDSADPAARKQVSDPAIVGQVRAAAKAGQPLPSPHVLGPDPVALKAIIDDPERQMLGARQEQWLGREIAASAAAGRIWQVLGNQVVMARTRAPDVVKAVGGRANLERALGALPDAKRKAVMAMADLYSFDIPYDLDDWDGYPAARERVFDQIKAAGEANVVVVSGDSHAFWADELHDDAGKLVAVEFGTSSVTSPTDGDSAPGLDLGRIFMDQNPEVIFCSQNDKGYIRLTLTREEARTELLSVDILTKPYGVRALATFRVRPTPGFAPGRIEKL